VTGRNIVEDILQERIDLVSLKSYKCNIMKIFTTKVNQIVPEKRILVKILNCHEVMIINVFPESSLCTGFVRDE